MYRVEHIEPSKTALIVVDMQNDFVAPGAPMQSPAGLAMVPQLQRALACCRASGIPVIYTAHVHRRNGCDLGLLGHAPAIARRDGATELAATDHQKRFRAKWAPVRIKKTRQNKIPEPGSDSIRTGL